MHLSLRWQVYDARQATGGKASVLRLGSSPSSLFFRSI